VATQRNDHTVSNGPSAGGSNILHDINKSGNYSHCKHMKSSLGSQL